MGAWKTVARITRSSYGEGTERKQEGHGGLRQVQASRRITTLRPVCVFSSRRNGGYKLSRERERRSHQALRPLQPMSCPPFQLSNLSTLEPCEPSPPLFTHGEGSILIRPGHHLLPDTRRRVLQAWPGPSDGSPRPAPGAGMTILCRGYRAASSPVVHCDVAASSDSTGRNLTP